MQTEKMNEEFVLIAVPREALTDSVIGEENVLQITAEKGKIVIKAVEQEDESEYICDGDCESCPLNETHCACMACTRYGKFE